MGKYKTKRQILCHFLNVIRYQSCNVFYQMTTASEHRRDNEALYNNMTIDELQASYPEASVLYIIICFLILVYNVIDDMQYYWSVYVFILSYPDMSIQNFVNRKDIGWFQFFLFIHDNAHHIKNMSNRIPSPSFVKSVCIIITLSVVNLHCCFLNVEAHG